MSCVHWEVTNPDRPRFSVATFLELYGLSTHPSVINENRTMWKKSNLSNM